MVDTLRAVRGLGRAPERYGRGWYRATGVTPGVELAGGEDQATAIARRADPALLHLVPQVSHLDAEIVRGDRHPDEHVTMIRVLDARVGSRFMLRVSGRLSHHYPCFHDLT